MAQLRIEAGRAYMVMSLEREASLRDLRDLLAKGGKDVDLEITHYVPGRMGVPPPGSPEDVAIFIVSNVSSHLIGVITSDVYKRAKSWARRRYEAKLRIARENGGDPKYVKGERFTIYGPDNEVLKSWTVDKDGEHGDDG